MTIYFTAVGDDEAAQALTTAPTGDEVFTSTVAPDGDAFTGLIEIITGTGLDQLSGDDFSVHNDVATDATTSLMRLGGGLVTEIAARDADEFAKLAGPWQRSGSVAADVDATDFLTDLQHLCRHAVAEKQGVYAVEGF